MGMRQVFRWKLKTRKSSCVNGRGIPPAVQQVLFLLSYAGVGGTPSKNGGLFHPMIRGTQSQDRGYPNRSQDRGVHHTGYPPRCGQTNKLKLLFSLSLRMRAVKSVSNKTNEDFVAEWHIESEFCWCSPQILFFNISYLIFRRSICLYHRDQTVIMDSSFVSIFYC